MGPILVVVSHVLVEQPAELPLVPDQGPIQQLVTHATNPTLRERVDYRCPRRCGDRVRTHSEAPGLRDCSGYWVAACSVVGV